MSSVTSNDKFANLRSQGLVALVLAWGLLLSVLQCRSFFWTPREAFWTNHDGYSYAVRLVEFEDCLAHGIASPQWCSHFRAGLGSPYFGFYQPGLFYVASAFPRAWSPIERLGGALTVFSFLGYVAVYFGLRSRSGTFGGLVGGTFLLTAPYGATNLLVRGDFSEYAGMMLVPVLTWAAVRCGERRDRRSTVVLALAAGALIVTHPVVALLAYGFAALAVLACLWLKPLRPAWPYLPLGLLAGVVISAFYWLPHFTEVKYVAASQAADGTRFDGFFHYSKHFVRLVGLFDFRPTDSIVPLKFGRVPTLAILISLGATWLAWRRLSDELKGQFLFCLACTLGCLFLMSGMSEPLWRWLPLLHKIQFPWRLYAVLTPAAAWLAGAWPPIRSKSLRFTCGLACVAALVVAGQLRSTPPLAKTREIRHAEELAEFYFAPDVAGEWMPVEGLRWAGALDDLGHAQRYLWPDAAQPAEIERPIRDLAPEPGPGVQVGDWRRKTAAFDCEIRTDRDSFVVLPQLYYAQGWRAKLADHECPLEPSDDGLTRVRLPGGAAGRLALEFHMTPARRNGWLMSLAGLISLLVLAFAPNRNVEDVDLAADRGEPRPS